VVHTRAKLAFQRLVWPNLPISASPNANWNAIAHPVARHGTVVAGVSVALGVGTGVSAVVGTGVSVSVGTRVSVGTDVGVGIGGGRAPKFLTIVVLVFTPESNVAVTMTGVSDETYPTGTTIDAHALPAGIATTDGTGKMSGRLLVSGTSPPADVVAQTVTLLRPSERLAVWV
jgi:hypothetical protein